MHVAGSDSCHDTLDVNCFYKNNSQAWHLVAGPSPVLYREHPMEISFVVAWANSPCIVMEVEQKFQLPAWSCEVWDEE